jgi:hypothetical protein
VDGSTVSFSPRFSTRGIGSTTRVCGGVVGTMNVSFRAPLFCIALRRLPQDIYIG